MDAEGGERGGGGGGRKVLGLIEKATNSTAREVDPRLLKAIKSVVRYSDSELRLAAETLTDLMKRDHSQVRYMTLLIIDELFMRSKLFRTLMVENLDLLLSLSVGFRKNMPLPAPPAIATLLRSKAIEYLEKWNMSFGFHYRQLRLGYDYLKNTLRFQFPNLQANATRIQQERREREMRTKEILINKFESLREDFSLIKDEIEETVKEIEECLEIVQPKEDRDVPLSFLDEEDLEEFRSSHLRQIRLDSLRESEKAHETNENKVVFDALREQYKLLITKHLVTANEWTSILIRVEATDTKLRDSMLKEFIDIRNLILAMKRKCEEAGCSISENRDKDVTGEEDFWEDSKIGIEATEDIHLSPRSKNLEKSSMASTSFNSLSSTPESQSSRSPEREAEENDTDPTRSKLLAEAPVVDWGPELNNWGSSTEVLANSRGLDLESHWGRVDPDAVIPADKVAELNLRATIYTEAEIEIQPCRAPLKKGGLCQRRDIKVCPFHGPVIPRDDEGNPIKQDFLMDEETNLDETALDAVGSDISERLAKQAVKNIRGKDKAEIRKGVTEKQSAKRAKRAKLAKIREHNDAVLRDAALASTSRSAVIDDIEFERIATGRKKEETLGSMLRKKTTTKDRLAQRLLRKRAKLT